MRIAQPPEVGIQAVEASYTRVSCLTTSEVVSERLSLVMLSGLRLRMRRSI